MKTTCLFFCACACPGVLILDSKERKQDAEGLVHPVLAAVAEGFQIHYKQAKGFISGLQGQQSFSICTDVFSVHRVEGGHQVNSNYQCRHSLKLLFGSDGLFIYPLIQSKTGNS